MNDNVSYGKYDNAYQLKTKLKLGNASQKFSVEVCFGSVLVALLKV